MTTLLDRINSPQRGTSFTRGMDRMMTASAGRLHKLRKQLEELDQAESLTTSLDEKDTEQESRLIRALLIETGILKEQSNS